LSGRYVEGTPGKSPDIGIATASQAPHRILGGGCTGR
jgi:hypothetical protein